MPKIFDNGWRTVAHTVRLDVPTQDALRILGAQRPGMARAAIIRDLIQREAQETLVRRLAAKAVGA